MGVIVVFHLILPSGKFLNLIQEDKNSASLEYIHTDSRLKLCYDIFNCDCFLVKGEIEYPIPSLPAIYQKIY